MTSYNKIPNIKNVSEISNIIFKNFLYYYNKNDNVNLYIHDFPNIIGSNERRVSLKQYIIQHELYNNKKNFHIIVSNYPSAIWNSNDDDETNLLPNWKAVNDTITNKTYYWNTSTNETTWNAPIVMKKVSNNDEKKNEKLPQWITIVRRSIVFLFRKNFE